VLGSLVINQRRIAATPRDDDFFNGDAATCRSVRRVILGVSEFPPALLAKKNGVA